MSTVDSYLNAVSTSIVNDILSPCKIILSPKKELFCARVITFFAGIIAAIMALYFENIFELAIYSSNFWGPLIVGPLLFGIFQIRISKNTCLKSMFCGVVAFLLWEYFDLKETTYIYSIIPSILANIMVLLVAQCSIKKKSIIKSTIQ